MTASNRFRAGKHDSPVECVDADCTARNAPPESDDYQETCWRCGTRLEDSHEAGDVYRVDIIDETTDGTAIGQTPAGLVVFLDEESSGIEERVRLTSVRDTVADGTIVEESETENGTEKGEKPPTALGRRDDFWGES